MNKYITQLAAISLVACCFSGCDDDPVSPEAPRSSVSIHFENKQDEHPENGGEKVIRLVFDAKATHSGTLTLAFNPASAGHFSTVPASQNGTIALPVAKGQNSATLLLTPANNALDDGDRTIIFTITKVTSPYTIGPQNAFSLTISDDESDLPDGSYANFIPANATIREDNPDGYILRVHLSEASIANGSVVIETESANAEFGVNFSTIPAMAGGKLTLPATPGTSVVSFKVLPLDNSAISGNLALTFRITSTTGTIMKGATLTDSFAITDDELENLPKGYEVVGGNWSFKKTFEYNTEGNFAKATWESYTPDYRHGADIYFYDGAKQLVKINRGAGQDLRYHWQHGKIVLEEKVDDGVVEGYTEYTYDEAGNVGGSQTYMLQADGQFSLTDITVFLYFDDGNIFKKLVYAPTDDPDEPLLLSTTTFDNYINKPNPFPMIEIVPTLKAQHKLPQTYRVQANGRDLFYHLSYEFREDGLVGKRIATRGNAIADVAVYHYY